MLITNEIRMSEALAIAAPVLSIYPTNRKHSRPSTVIATGPEIRNTRVSPTDKRMLTRATLVLAAVTKAVPPLKDVYLRFSSQFERVRANEYERVRAMSR